MKTTMMNNCADAVAGLHIVCGTHSSTASSLACTCTSLPSPVPMTAPPCSPTIYPTPCKTPCTYTHRTCQHLHHSPHNNLIGKHFDLDM
ncbi:hypothetical protein K439DRAFT_117185 [Ramaria rubella]|nr:hypothetical protein K439DRAFT_117185 [Ramaria rubella]